jgi:Zn2+/Cd2+-exporting ATPase
LFGSFCYSKYLKYISLVSVAFGIPPIALKAFRTIQRYQFDTNCLLLVAAVGAIGLQDYEESAAVVFLFALSEWLEVRATTRARIALSAIIQLRPETATIVHPYTKEHIVVHADDVPVGTIVTIRAGDKVPCDGIILSGVSTIDESSLTGESCPIRKGPSDTISGGTTNSGLSPIIVQTTATSDNSAVSRLIRLVEEAQTNRSETELMVDKFAKVYTPVIVVTALVMCIVPSIIFGINSETTRVWTKNGLVLLIVACPCALIISTPVAYVAGLAVSAQNGVLIKGGAYLESLAMVKHICFDKTGTLTNGNFSLLHLNVLSKTLSRNTIFQYLVMMEECASHPISQAIVDAAKREKIIVPNEMKLEKHTIIEGEGVSGVINGLQVYVGNEKMFERLQLLKDVTAVDRQVVQEWKNIGGTIGFMSIEGYGIVCSYCAADSVRGEAKNAISTLRTKLGLSIHMLTGDNTDSAHSIGRQVGLDHDEIKSKLLPEEKFSHIKELVNQRRNVTNSNQQYQSSQIGSKQQLSSRFTLSPSASTTSILSFHTKRCLVLMCGDGLNDAPALAAADVGVAMGAGATLAMETADITLLDSNLDKLVFCIQLGRQVSYKILQNVIFSIVIKLIVVGFAFCGRTTLWAAICADVGAMLVVTLNAMTIIPRVSSSSSSSPYKNNKKKKLTRIDQQNDTICDETTRLLA